MKSILSILKLAQSAVLVLMFVRLKQFTRQNNNHNKKKKKSPVSKFWDRAFYFISPMCATVAYPGQSEEAVETVIIYAGNACFVSRDK